MCSFSLNLSDKCIKEANETISVWVLCKYCVNEELIGILWLEQYKLGLIKHGQVPFSVCVWGFLYMYLWSGIFLNTHYTHVWPLSVLWCDSLRKGFLHLVTHSFTLDPLYYLSGLPRKTKLMVSYLYYKPSVVWASSTVCVSVCVCVCVCVVCACVYVHVCMCVCKCVCACVCVRVCRYII